MQNQAKCRIILIGGTKYYDDRPESCHLCFFWKNRKVGCVLGKENCYYLAEPIKTEQERKCDGCGYASDRPCIGICCRDLDTWLHVVRRKNGKEGAAHE